MTLRYRLVLPAIAAALTALCAQSSAAVPTFLLKWDVPVRDSSRDEVNPYVWDYVQHRPSDITLDGAGNVNVIDCVEYLYWSTEPFPGSGSVYQYSSGGTPIRQWSYGGDGYDVASMIVGIGTTPAGDLLIADGFDCTRYGGSHFGHGIQAAPDGSLLALFASPDSASSGQRPTDIAAGPDGDVYVAQVYPRRYSDPHARSIRRYAASGAYLGGWEIPFAGSPRPDWMGALTLTVDGSGNVYVCDPAQCRVQVFDRFGTLLRQWGSYGGDPGQFSAPHGIAMYGPNHVLVANSGMNRVDLFTRMGAFVGTWGGPGGAEDGQFNYPDGVVVDPDLNVYVLDAGNYRVQKFGNLVTPVTISGVSAEAGPDGVDLKWTAFLDGAAEFQVFRSAAAAGPFEPLGARLPGSSATREFRSTDRTALPGAEYFYRLGWIQSGSEWNYSGTAQVRMPAAALALSIAGPNPSAGPVRLAYGIARPGPVDLSIFSVEGRRVRSLVVGSLRAGREEITWDGRDGAGRLVPPGLYFARLGSAGGARTERIVLIR